MSGDTQRVGRPKARWSWSAFLGMLSSGALASLVILIFLGVSAWSSRSDRARERKSLVNFFAIEVTELYGDACERAHAFTLHRKRRRTLATRLADAALIERAIALADDARLVGHLRAFYGSHARFEGLVERAYERFADGGDADAASLGVLVDECAVMQDVAGEILRIAKGEDLDVNVMTQLEASMGKPAELLEEMKRNLSRRATERPE